MEETYGKGDSLLSIALALLLVVVMWLPTAGPAHAAGGEWEWQNPYPTGNTLNGVWGSSGSDVFAVGEAGTILHYHGSAWSAMISGTTMPLNEVNDGLVEMIMFPHIL